jgi:hypothetical protein
MAAYKLLESKNRDVPFIAITERAALVVTGLKTISIGDGYVSRYDFKIEQLIKPIIEI